MQKRAPTIGNILVIILFVLSCFGLLMFLWASFGGPLPLKPKGYRFNVGFTRALALTEQSEVRISGVTVGHVISVHLGPEGRSVATVEVDGQYAPIRRSSEAILRQKTLLGETYVQLIPKLPQAGPYIRDGGRLPNSHVKPSVTLDDIISTFNAETRQAFQTWQKDVALGINGRGEQINSDFASLHPFVENANALVTVLEQQEGAVRALVRETGTVFNALAGRNNQLERFIASGAATFHAAAAASDSFAQAFRELPEFERRSSQALRELDTFQTTAVPYFDEFKKAEIELARLLHEAEPFAPQFNRLLTDLGPLSAAAKTALPDIGKSLALTEPVLENLRPVLHNLDPFLQYNSEYVRELQAFFANLTAASTFHGENSNVEGAPESRLLTAMSVVTPESLSVFKEALGYSRLNAYPLAGTYRSLLSGLPVYQSKHCTAKAPYVEGPANEVVSAETIQLLEEFKVVNPAGSSENHVGIPACNQQGKAKFNGEESQFPHVTYKP
ncbi:MAG TPA: MlaD family protein [Solirubrobacteraceae bacterium]|nr:MlaD family protein [Solirubrobacteraceae bacterium]